LADVIFICLTPGAYSENKQEIRILGLMGRDGNNKDWGLLSFITTCMKEFDDDDDNLLIIPGLTVFLRASRVQINKFNNVLITTL
jgi:hypothetical protein